MLDLPVVHPFISAEDLQCQPSLAPIRNVCFCSTGGGTGTRNGFPRFSSLSSAQESSLADSTRHLQPFNITYVSFLETGPLLCGINIQLLSLSVGKASKSRITQCPWGIRPSFCFFLFFFHSCTNNQPFVPVAPACFWTAQWKKRWRREKWFAERKQRSE